MTQLTKGQSIAPKMDKLFISLNHAKSSLQVQAIAPWAESILRVDSGWIAFASTKEAYEFRDRANSFPERAQEL